MVVVTDESLRAAHERIAEIRCGTHGLDTRAAAGACAHRDRDHRGRAYYFMTSPEGEKYTGVVEGASSANNDDDQTPSPPVATVARTTTVAPPTDAAVGFLDAYGVIDADRRSPICRRRHHRDVEICGGGVHPGGVPAGAGPARSRGVRAHDHRLRATGDSASGTGVRCSYDFHSIRSDEIGLGPYTDNYWDKNFSPGVTSD